ncbi:hypothetical protein Tco_1017163, partial [Tanacetum coccineum]
FVMSDSEDSTVTYTEVSSPFEDLSDLGSSGVIEPPPPDFVPGPVYPEFMPPEDDVLLAEEQPLPAAVSPTADSLGYITDFDPKEDLKEDDEDPEEDPSDYPTNKDDEEEDEDEEEEEHLAPADSVPPPTYRTTARMSIRAQTPIPFPSEAEIPSPPLPLSPPLPISPLPLHVSHTHLLGYKAATIQLRAESPSTSHPLPLPPPIILPRTRASMAMMRAASPSTYCLAPPLGTLPILPIPLPTSSPPLLLPSNNCRADVPKVTLPPQKRLCIAPGPRYKVGKCSSAPTARPTRGFRANYGFVGTLDADIRRDPDREIGYGITDVRVDPDKIAEEVPATDVAELGQRMTDFVTTVRQDTYEIYERLDDAQDDKLLMSSQLNLLRRDRRSHARTARLMEAKTKAYREAWVQSMDASDTAHAEFRALRTTVLAQQTEIRDLRFAYRRRQAQHAEALTLLKTLQTHMVAL